MFNSTGKRPLICAGSAGREVSLHEDGKQQIATNNSFVFPSKELV